MQYDWDVGANNRAFVGASLQYQGKSQASFATEDAPAPDFVLDARHLVDLRAGFGAADDSWQVSVFGRNVFNEYYVVTANKAVDYFTRVVGQPATYGVRLTVNY